MNCQRCGVALIAGAKFCSECGAAVIQGSGLRVTIPEQIAKRAEKFAGRLWVLDEVIDWLDNGYERFLLITGEPGCGKTALAAWLAGAGSTPENAGALRNLDRVRDAWNAAHFCVAEDRRGSLNPSRFAQSLARQLSDRYDEYAQAVIHRVAPQINIDQQVRENWGSIIGAQIDTLIINAQAEEVYNRAVREPLDELFNHQPDLRILILVDALDEALTFGPGNIVTLLAGSGDLPAGVRFLITSRNEPKVTDQFRQIRRLNLSSQEKSSGADADIRDYVRQRMAEEDLNKTAPPAATLQNIIDSMVKQAAGNFLYVEFLLEEVAKGQRPLTSLEGLPRGLYGLYRTFLDRIMPEMLQVGGSKRWLEQFQPLLGSLSVAVPTAPLSVLHGWVGCKEGEITALLNELIQITEYDPEEGGGYRLYHRSMADFLAAATYEESGNPVINRYYTPHREQHARIAGYYLNTYQGDWKRCDLYGLRQLVSHIRACFDLEQKPKELEERIKELNLVVLNEEFRSAQLEKLGDPLITLNDLREVLKICVNRDYLVPALACIGTIRDTKQSVSLTKNIFDAVAARDFERASQRARLFGGDVWASVLNLYVVWEAAESGDTNAVESAIQQLGNNNLIRAGSLGDALMARTARVVAQKSGDSPDARALLEGWGWAEDAVRLLGKYAAVEKHDQPVIQQFLSNIEQSLAYLEQTIAEGSAEGVSMAPFLDSERAGSFAGDLQEQLVRVADDLSGQFAIDRALKSVLGNPYPQYRDIALTAVGTAVVSVPDPSWVRDRLQRILGTTLEREGITFTFDLPSILVTEARRRNLKAPELEEYLDKALSTEDRWGTAARAKSAHAAAMFFNGDVDGAFEELEKADQMDIGMAGFSTLTLLSFADRCYEFGHPEKAMNAIWGSNKDITLLDGALGVAQRVRDPKFRNQRIRLVEEYGQAFNADLVAAYSLVFKSIFVNPARDMVLLAHLSAKCCCPPENPKWEALKSLVPLVLDDSTSLDALIARIFRLRIKELSDNEVVEAIRICTKYLTTGRPWEFGQWR